MANDPLLLLHGVTMSAAAWDDVVPYLSSRFDVFAPTLMGHRGGTKPGDGGVTLSALTDDIERALNAKDLDTVHIAGNSLGGWIAIELARRGRARSVCAFSPAGFWDLSTHQETRASSSLLRTVRLASLTRFVAPPLLHVPLVRRITMRDIAEHPERLTQAQAHQAMLDVVGCVAAEEILSTSETVAPLDPLPCPVTLVWSEQDRIFPPAVNGVIARERLPAARYITLPGVGHVPMIDDPKLCAETIVSASQVV